MKRTLALISLLVIIVGLALGYYIAPKYQPPKEAGQGRLRKRAATFYRALRQMDYLGATRLMTPARQYAEAAQLRVEAQATKSRHDKLSAESQASLTKNADSIQAEQLSIRVEGDWALTSGLSDVYEGGQPVRLALEDLVWICVDGDWWNYDMTTAELAAYGNPPDFARDVLLVKKNKPTTRDLSAPPADLLPKEAAPADKSAAAQAGAGGSEPAPDSGAGKQGNGNGS